MLSIDQLLSIHPWYNYNKTNDNNNKDNNIQNNRRTNKDNNRNNQNNNTKNNKFTNSNNKKINKGDPYIVISFVDFEPKTTNDTYKWFIYKGYRGVCSKQKR